MPKIEKFIIWGAGSTILPEELLTIGYVYGLDLQFNPILTIIAPCA
jgi:hypothetical protein